MDTWGSRLKWRSRCMNWRVARGEVSLNMVSGVITKVLVKRNATSWCHGSISHLEPTGHERVFNVCGYDFHWRSITDVAFVRMLWFWTMADERGSCSTTTNEPGRPQKARRRRKQGVIVTRLRDTITSATWCWRWHRWKRGGKHPGSLLEKRLLA